MSLSSRGKSAFIFIGENPALDFANTLALDAGRPREFLRSWSDVVGWLAEAKLSADASLALPTTRQGDALQAVIELRRAWEKTLAQLVAGGKVSDAFLHRLNALLAHETFHEILHREGKSSFHLERSSSRLQGSQLVLALLARQIAGFLADANLDHLHRCANTDSCVLYFYDTTKNHRRQWCSVATCGNRHKVAQFRKRAAKK
jgi:predicted RNA-binding Zn ribbon-like protein